MRLRWSRQSVQQLTNIRSYISRHNPVAAEGVRIRILEAVALLSQLPRLGRVGRKNGTREFVVPRSPIIIVYRLDIGDEDELVILGIFHGGQQH